MSEEIFLPDNVLRVLERLNERGYEAYAVGGCVRNALLGLPAKDFDVTTDASPYEIKASFPDMRTVDTGIRYGTVTVISNGMPVEVTTYRIDGEYCDNRRPDSVKFTKNISEDLRRRDFTVNAMAYNPATGIIDLFNGREDLDNRIIRAIGNPDERFNEDGLRILRALRFASCYNMSVEEKTAEAVHRNRFLLKNIAVERITSEFDKFICGNCESLLREFRDVTAVFLPEIERCFDFEQHTKYHDRDVFEHIIATVGAVKPQKYLRIAMLLHDIGKPDYFVMGEDGVGHFKKHAAGSSEIAESYLKRMKYDRETTEKVLFLVKHHDIVIENRESLIKRFLSKYGEEMFFDLIEVHIADDMGKAREYRERIKIYNAAAETARDIISRQECFSLKNLAVNGNDVKKLGFTGAEIGEKLNYLLESVMDNKCENSRESLIEYLKGEK